MTAVRHAEPAVIWGTYELILSNAVYPSVASGESVRIIGVARQRLVELP